MIQNSAVAEESVDQKGHIDKSKQTDKNDVKREENFYKRVEHHNPRMPE